MIYCANCGSKNQANATFCANCGAKLVKPAQSSQLTQQVQPVKPAKTGKRRADLKQVRKWEDDLDDVFEDSVSLGEDGHYFFFFPKYKLMVKTYSPTVVTNHENSTIKMNGKNVGKLSASGDYYQKKLDRRPLYFLSFSQLEREDHFT
ncbi:zinc-ribbon domain-containing protein [Lactobacillus delbrueckii]|uniref:zinc-ribbon domain-containing protein n=1 Tax=Lactobacillus delbrueckii TaxID=1584 RepID=UPI00005106DF|nr:zinc ribbon domain-containing protein [Lactobacillus delbrueckii]ABJ59281.1 Predicted membrane protein [Lactobacillus delbrueckii subsp. bulgaricus ATCC BAA-365]MBT8938405.1 zinc ribbon domain-containing protein [Lactobacillus delbrueckii subsp. bulgaricus]